MLPPYTYPDWTPEDMQVIGGFILYFRAAALRGLAGVSDAEAKKIPDWQDSEIAYWESVERATRWLLSFTPYPVQKGQLWTPPDPAKSR